MRFVDAWRESLGGYRERPYLAEPGQRLSGAEAEAEVGRFAAAFLAHGLRPGDTVAFYGRGDAQWVIAQLAVLLAGGSIALMPSSADETLLARLLSQAAPKYIFASSADGAERCIRAGRGVRSVVQTILQRGVIRNPAVVSLDLLLESGDLYRRDGKGALATGEPGSPDDIAVLAFSAGTLGFSRSVAIGHERLERQVSVVAERLGAGPALYSTGRFELIDQAVLVWAAIRAGREVVFGAPPQRLWEWAGTAPELADSLFGLTWPVVGPGALPRGWRRRLFNRKLAGYLRANFPGLAGVHCGFSVLPESLLGQLSAARVRVTWGYGLVEAHGFVTWEESLRGYGVALPQIKLATHNGKLVFDYADRPTAWWQTGGDWARAVGPWITDLEPHGSERGEALALHNARRIQEAIADHPWISSVYVSGPDPMGNVALITLRAHPVLAWAQEQRLGELDWAKLVNHPALTEPLLARVRAIGHRHGVKLEPIVLERGLSVESGELTLRGELRRALILRQAAAYVQAPRPGGR